VCCITHHAVDETLSFNTPCLAIYIYIYIYISRLVQLIKFISFTSCSKLNISPTDRVMTWARQIWMYTETDFHIKRAVSYEIYTLHVRRYAVVYSRWCGCMDAGDRRLTWRRNSATITLSSVNCHRSPRQIDNEYQRHIQTHGQTDTQIHTELKQTVTHTHTHTERETILSSDVNRGLGNW